MQVAPGMLVFGVGAVGASSHPHTLVRACSHPAGKDGVFQGAREREEKAGDGCSLEENRLENGQLRFLPCVSRRAWEWTSPRPSLQPLFKSFLGKGWGNGSLQQIWTLLQPSRRAAVCLHCHTWGGFPPRVSLSPCLRVCAGAQSCARVRLYVEVRVHLYGRSCVSIHLYGRAYLFLHPSPRLLERLREEGVGWAVSRIVDIPGSASFSALIL